MNDRGEKIITLAREMLRSDVTVDAAPITQKPAISFKILCLATVLTAVASSAVTQWSQQNQRPINRYERTEINALIFYASRLRGLHEGDLKQEVEQKLNISDLDDMTMQEFQLARRYLQDKAQ